MEDYNNDNDLVMRMMRMVMVVMMRCHGLVDTSLDKVGGSRPVVAPMSLGKTLIYNCHSRPWCSKWVPGRKNFLEMLECLHPLSPKHEITRVRPYGNRTEIKSCSTG